MIRGFRNGVISFAFGATVCALRLRRVLSGLGKPRIRTVDHVTIPVHDLDAAQRFYCDLLGGALLARIDNDFFRRVGRPVYAENTQGVFHVSLLFGGATRIDLFQQNYGQAAAAQGHPHYAFRVRPRDLPKWKARLEVHGIPCDGPLQLGPPGQASLYFNDPFGNHLELECMGYAESIPARPPEMARIVWPSKAFAAQQ
ncbi:VOC family protein [Methylovirgula sp. HY1]|uniref:VOC family protein n=1 Tax=Methylovirgula sp. HY1 TaxID=2822761 RepID=UPI001C5A87CE|nr:VOC family protein [Methylovirgula sp. HY1]QXX74855.1 Metallothiol transferase FosB [Methylovirgula sp. HY1]